MTSADTVVMAARHAEGERWRHYGLTVVERFIDIAEPRLRVRMLEGGSPFADPRLFVQGGLGEAWGWGRQLRIRACIAGMFDIRTHA